MPASYPMPEASNCKDGHDPWCLGETSMGNELKQMVSAEKKQESGWEKCFFFKAIPFVEKSPVSSPSHHVFGFYMVLYKPKKEVCGVLETCFARVWRESRVGSLIPLGWSISQKWGGTSVVFLLIWLQSPRLVLDFGSGLMLDSPEGFVWNCPT